MAITTEIMNKLKLLPIFLLPFLFCCKSKKEDFEFVFFQWNIHENYYLKINSSDTIYWIADNPIEKQTKFAILNKEQKEKIQNSLSSLSFPKENHFSSNSEDGVTYAFIYKDKMKTNNLMLHANVGPKQFWQFGEYLEKVKNDSKFTKIEKKINLNWAKKLLKIVSPPPPPPKVNEIKYIK